MSDATMEAGKHGFSGSCAPDSGHQFRAEHFQTFSLGIFEWVNKASGRGVKKGPVRVRVCGATSNAEAVKAKAEEIAKLLDSGTYSGPKNVKI